ncbi:hypothetical protein FKM82_006347, partial [Ascaphus truei]
MFRRLQSFCRHILNNYINFDSRQEEGEDTLDETQFHKQKFLIWGKTLRNSNLPIGIRIQAASQMGLLSYTGGPPAACHVQEYIEDIIHFLDVPSASIEDKMIIIQALSGICYVNNSNQKKLTELGITNKLLTILSEEGNSSADTTNLMLLKYWVCYLLSVLSCNNIPFIKSLQNIHTLRTNLETISIMGWYKWPANYAAVMLDLLSIKPSNE